MAAESKAGGAAAGSGKSDEFLPMFEQDVPQALAQARGGDLAGALERLLSLEKKTRMAGDANATAKLAVASIRIAFELGDLKALNSQILVLSKRRGQLKQATAEMVGEAMSYIERMPGKADRAELIATLRTVTEGKIYAEVERARLTRMLAMLQEEEGRIGEASETLQEIQIETLGSMERKEKAEFLLEQVRLTAAQKDWVRMGILANKMNKKLLEEAGAEDVRLRHYELLAALHAAKRDALALSKDYAAIYATRGVADGPQDKWAPALQSQLLYLAMAPWDNEVSDALHRLKAEKRTEELPSYRALLNFLTTDELIPWPLPEPHNSALRAHPAFAAGSSSSSSSSSSGAAGDLDMEGSAAAPAAAAAGGAAAAAAAAITGSAGPRIRSAIVSLEDEGSASWWALLHKRLVQHNLRVLAKCYSRLRSARLSFLLGLDASTTEAVLSEMVASKALYARIDRPAGIVVFARPRPSAEVMAEWSSDVDRVLGLLERTTSLIQKEYMVKGMQQQAAAAAAAAGRAGR